MPQTRWLFVGAVDGGGRRGAAGRHARAGKSRRRDRGESAALRTGWSRERLAGDSDRRVSIPTATASADPPATPAAPAPSKAPPRASGPPRLAWAEFLRAPQRGPIDGRRPQRGAHDGRPGAGHRCRQGRLGRHPRFRRRRARLAARPPAGRLLRRGPRSRRRHARRVRHGRRPVHRLDDDRWRSWRPPGPGRRGRGGRYALVRRSRRSSQALEGTTCPA